MGRTANRSADELHPARDETVSGEPRILLRPALHADVDAIAALDERITGLSKAPHWLELIERQQQLTPPGTFLVATTAEPAPRLLGFIVGEVRTWEFGSAPCGWVYALAVNPDERLHGVGELMLEAISQAFRAAGVRKMRTMVARDDRLPMLFFRGEGMMAGPYVQLEKNLD